MSPFFLVFPISFSPKPSIIKSLQVLIKFFICCLFFYIIFFKRIFIPCSIAHQNIIGISYLFKHFLAPFLFFILALVRMVFKSKFPVHIPYVFQRCCFFSFRASSISSKLAIFNLSRRTRSC